MNDEKPRAPCPDYYRSIPTRDGWELHCRAKGCKVAYGVTEAGAKKVGVALQLLNHWRSHQANR